jgi:hypothetical protein
VEFRGIAFWSCGRYESEVSAAASIPKNIDSGLHWRAAGQVGTAQQILSHNPFEILVLALDAVPGAPVRLYRQECEDCIDVTWLDSFTALRSLKLVEDVVVDMIDVFHVLPRL